MARPARRTDSRRTRPFQGAQSPRLRPIPFSAGNNVRVSRLSAAGCYAASMARQDLDPPQDVRTGTVIWTVALIAGVGLWGAGAVWAVWSLGNWLGTLGH